MMITTNHIYMPIVSGEMVRMNSRPISWGRSSRRWGSCTWCWWRRPLRLFAPGVPGSIRWGPPNWAAFAGCIRSCRRCSSYCCGRCWKSAEFDGSMGPLPRRSSLPKAPIFGLFWAWLRWSRGRGCWGRLNGGIFTFDGDDELGNDGKDLVAALVQQVVGAHNRKGTIGVEFLSGSVEENGKVVMVVQGFHGNLPDQLGQGVLVVHTDGEVAAIVVPSELRERHFSFLEGAGFGGGFLEGRLLFEGAGDAASNSLRFWVFGEWAGEGELVFGFVLWFFDFFLGDVLLGEVSEGGVRVRRCVLVFPGLVALVVLLAENAAKLVLAWVRAGVHWICEARLSRRRVFAKELCCSLGSMEVIKIK